MLLFIASDLGHVYAIYAKKRMERLKAISEFQDEAVSFLKLLQRSCHPGSWNVRTSLKGLQARLYMAHVGCNLFG